LHQPFAFWALMGSITSDGRLGLAIPSMRPPGLPTWVLAPTVEFVAAVPCEVAVDPLAQHRLRPVNPVEFAVPAVFVPGTIGTFAELPAPLGSFPELASPPAFAGPFGTPLTAAVPAPGASAFGIPTGLAAVNIPRQSRWL
jgi:hypothetical protein